MDYMLIFDILIGALGLYLVYTAFQMKRSGEISTMIINQDDITRCKDKQGFIDMIYRKVAVFGGVSLVFSVFNGISDGIHSFGRVFNIAGVTVFLIVWIWFTWHLRKGREKFFY